MDKEELIKALDEISQYFYGCYRNAGGTKACTQFHTWMCAADEAKEIIETQNTERHNLISWLGKFCTHIDFKEPLNDEERTKLFQEKLKQQFAWK